MDGRARPYDRMRADFKLTEPKARETVKAVRSEDQLKQPNRILHRAQLDHQDDKVKKTLSGYTLTRIKKVFPIYEKPTWSK